MSITGAKEKGLAGGYFPRWRSEMSNLEENTFIK